MRLGELENATCREWESPQRHVESACARPRRGATASSRGPQSESASLEALLWIDPGQIGQSRRRGAQRINLPSSRDGVWEEPINCKIDTLRKSAGLKAHRYIGGRRSQLAGAECSRGEIFDLQYCAFLTCATVGGWFCLSQVSTYCVTQHGNAPLDWRSSEHAAPHVEYTLLLS